MTATVTPLRKAVEANSTSSAFTTKIPTLTEPTGAGVFKLTDPLYGVGVDGKVPAYLQLVPFGGNDNNDTFSLRVWGWSKTGYTATPLYIPQLLIELAVTLGSISGTAIAANMLLADTLVVTYGGTADSSLGNSVISPANDVPANCLVDTRGCEYIEFDFDLTGTGDAANTYWRVTDQD